MGTPAETVSLEKRAVGTLAETVSLEERAVGTLARGWLGFLSQALGKDEGMKSEKKKKFHKICCQK